jgi:hypothetical protein
MPKSEIFFVTPELQQVLDSLPPGTPRSKLDPLRPFILRWRRERRGYREIQQILRNECRVKASLSTLFHFVKSRSKPRKPIQPDFEIEPATVQPVASSSAAVSPVERKPRMTLEERRAQADAIRAQFAKPALPTKPEDTRPRFEYDPDKPLTLIKSKEK